MPAIWTEADLASRGFNPDGSRVARRDPVAGGGVDGAECGSEGVDGPADLPREATEPNPGGAYAADRRPLAAGGNGSRPVKSRQAGGSPAPRNKFGAVRTEGLGPNGERRIYDSRRECERARQLAMLKSAGVIEDWFPQIPIPYGEHKNGRPAKTIVDFMVVHEYLPDGRMLVEFEDAKGFHDKASQARYAALRARGFRITLR